MFDCSALLLCTINEIEFITLVLLFTDARVRQKGLW